MSSVGLAEYKALVEWARKLGAVEVAVGDMRVTFPSKPQLATKTLAEKPVTEEEALKQREDLRYASGQ